MLYIFNDILYIKTMYTDRFYKLNKTNWYKLIE